MLTQPWRFCSLSDRTFSHNIPQSHQEERDLELLKLMSDKVTFTLILQLLYTQLTYIYMYIYIYGFVTGRPYGVWCRGLTNCHDSTGSLRWRLKGRDGVSNHQPHDDCLLNSLFGRRSKKTSKFRVTGLCAGNSPGQVTRKMFPFDDVIMDDETRYCGSTPTLYQWSKHNLALSHRDGALRNNRHGHHFNVTRYKPTPYKESSIPAS